MREKIRASEGKTLQIKMSSSSDASDDATKRSEEIKSAFDSSALDKRSRITNADKQKYLALDPRKDLVRYGSKARQTWKYLFAFQRTARKRTATLRFC